jgi:hypothetical protein
MFDVHTFLHAYIMQEHERSCCENARNKKFSSSKFSSRTTVFFKNSRPLHIKKYNGGG